MIYCPNYGTKIIPGAKLYPNYGEKLEFAPENAAGESTVENSEATQQIENTTGENAAGSSETMQQTKNTTGESTAENSGATQQIRNIAGESVTKSSETTQQTESAAANGEVTYEKSRSERDTEEITAYVREVAEKVAEEARRVGEDIVKYAKEKVGQAGQEANWAANSTAQAAHEAAEEVARQDEALRQHWTPGNTERLTALAPFTTFTAVVFGYVLYFLRGITYSVSANILPLYDIACGLSGLFGIAFWVGKLLSYLLSLADVVVGVQLYDGKEKQTAGMIMCLGVNVLALIIPLLRLSGRGNLFSTFLSIALTSFTLDALSRIFLRGTGIESDIQPNKDLAVFESFVGSPKEKMEQSATEMKPKRTETTAMSREIPGPSKSVFDGNGLECSAIDLFGALPCTITFGLAGPWVICYAVDWERRHSIYGGRWSVFNDTSVQLFGEWTIRLLSITVIYGLYGSIMGLRLGQWILNHTALADEVNDPNNPDMSPNSGFDGSMFRRISYNLVTALAETLTRGIVVPWMVCSFNKWCAPNVRIPGKCFRFDGSGVELFGQYIVALLLNIIACGLYAPWGFVKPHRWRVSCVRVAGAV